MPSRWRIDGQAEYRSFVKTRSSGSSFQAFKSFDSANRVGERDADDLRRLADLDRHDVAVARLADRRVEQPPAGQLQGRDRSSQCLEVVRPEGDDPGAVPVVHAEGPHRAALGVGAAQVIAVGEGRGRLARLHVDEAEVGVAGRVGLVVLADVLEAVEPVPEDDGGRLHHVEVERAQLADLRGGSARRHGRPGEPRREARHHGPEQDAGRSHRRAHSNSWTSCRTPLGMQTVRTVSLPTALCRTPLGT